MGEKMKDPRELLLHSLGDLLYAENLLVKTLPKLSEEASDTELKKGFDKHTKQTQQHVTNLERTFKALKAEPKAEQCPAMDGLKKEHDEFVEEEEPTQDVLDSFLTGSAARTEHYEIAAYTGAITLARAMGERQAVQLLERNLKQEKETLKDVEKIARRLAREGAKENGARTNGRTTRSRAGSRK
jgi:ferritin-like metal-binding protein YciE